MRTPDEAPIHTSAADDARPSDSSVPFIRYFIEASKATLFQTPRWDRLPNPTPGFVLLICVLSIALEFVAGYYLIEGAKRFYPQAITAGWLTVIALLWACWASLQREHVVTPNAVRPGDNVAAEMSGNVQTNNAPYVPSALSALSTVSVTQPTLGKLFVVSLLLGQIIYTITSLVYVPLYRLDVFSEYNNGEIFQWIAWGFGLVWTLIAQIILFARVTPAPMISSAAVLALLASSAVHIWAQPATFWYPDYSTESREDTASKLDQSYLQPAKLLQQATVLDTALAALPAQRQGVVDTYVITYSPYAGEDVFLKEGEVVTRVMNDRFGTNTRTLRLVNHASTVETLAWATPENLKKTIEHIGKLIDPAEDMIFIHFASHGGSDGKLSAEFWPLQIETLTGTGVRTMLDDANIPVRVLSVSACYSGSWIEPLRTQGTFVMTASDAKHTSYGCGRKSDLTYFTRAVFDEQLSKETLSFEDAFNASRPIIEAREKEAGKKDGYSNPQIFIGDVARARMARWTKEIAATGSSQKP
jgi:Peptidase C13 family